MLTSGASSSSSERLRTHDKPLSVAEQVVESIRGMILRGDLEAGAPLRQDALARALRVSRIPVREALRQLEAEGLVTLLAHRGAVVSALPLTQIHELFDVRTLLEQDLLRRAIPRLTEADFARATEVLDIAEGPFALTDARFWRDLNWRFHATLYGAAGRPLTFGVARTLHLNADRYMRLLFHAEDAVARSERDHRRLLALCRDRRVEPACACLGDHLAGARDTLAEYLAARQPAGAVPRLPPRHIAERDVARAGCGPTPRRATLRSYVCSDRR